MAVIALEIFMDTRPRILFLLHLPPPVHGSSVVGMNVKDSIWIKKDFDCSYTNLLASKNLAQTGKVNFRKIFDFINIFAKVLVVIIKDRPTLCYIALTSTGLAFYRDLALVTIIKLFRIKRIYHLHNKGVSLHQNNSLSRFCYRYVFNGADVIILSQYLYSDIQKFVPKSKIHICPNGILDEVSNSESQSQCLQPHFPTSINEHSEEKLVQILFLSNLLKAKGVFTLLNACTILAKKEVSFRCVFIGSEGDITASQFNDRVDQLGLTQHVVYLGKKFGQEKYKAFAESDIFAFPTHFETFGLVNLEAMQHSVPIISTQEGGIPDIIDDNITGFLIPKKDSLALANKLEFLIKNPELCRQMGAAGRDKYKREFTLEKFEHNFTDILHLVIQNNMNN